MTPTLAQASRAAAAAFAATLRRCRWLTYWHDTVMPCPERAIPGGALCAEHLIDNERTKP